MLIQRIWGQPNNTNKVKPIGFMVADFVKDMDNCVSIGLSICHETDKFDKVKGRKMAEERVQFYRVPYQLKNRYNCRMIDETVWVQFIQFVDRCNRYYRNSMVILPKVRLV